MKLEFARFSLIHKFYGVKISIWLFIVCTLLSSMVKSIFYQIVGLIYGLTPSTLHDDFWLYDFQINPLNIPSVIVFNKSKDRTPEQWMEHMAKCMNFKNRTRAKTVQLFGKYYFQDIPVDSPEYQTWKKENLFILWDIKTDQDILDFFCRIKKLDLRNSPYGGV